MKLIRRKFLIMALVCCVGMQPVILTNTDLSFGQRYLLKIADTPWHSNCMAVFLQIQNVMMIFWAAHFMQKWMENNRQVIIQVQNGTKQPVYNISVDSGSVHGLAQEQDQQIEQQKDLV